MRNRLETVPQHHLTHDRTHKIKMANKETEPNSLYPIAVLIDELRNDDVNVSLSVSVDRVLSRVCVCVSYRFDSPSAIGLFKGPEV